MHRCLYGRLRSRLHGRLCSDLCGGPTFCDDSFRCGISCRFDLYDLTDAERIIRHPVPCSKIFLGNMIAFGNIVYRITTHDRVRRRINVDRRIRRNICTRNRRRRRHISGRRINRRTLHRRHIRCIVGRSRTVRRCTIRVVVDRRRLYSLHS